MSAHQVAPTASTPRTRPTISSPSKAHTGGKARPGRGDRWRWDVARVIFPSRAASSGVRTRSIDMEDGGWNAPQRLHEKTFRREQPIAQCLTRSDRLVRLLLLIMAHTKKRPARVAHRIHLPGVDTMRNPLLLR